MNGSNIDSLLQHIEAASSFHMMVNAATGYSPGLDLSIEGMRSQQFSVGVFIFMLLGVLVFVGIIYAFAFGKAAPKKMKTGEKVLFIAIAMGTMFAVGMGAVQMLSGYLF
ncbi:MAG: hypothetical protein GC139_04380 [Sideroxydans sp.]|nr:hypothetical protein [Sideroxydans sp.]